MAGDHGFPGTCPRVHTDRKTKLNDSGWRNNSTDVENVSWLLYKGCLYFFIP